MHSVSKHVLLLIYTVSHSIGLYAVTAVDVQSHDSKAGAITAVGYAAVTKHNVLISCDENTI